MTTIQIPSSEKDVHESICALFDIGIKFYTQENNPEMLTVQVDTDNPAIMYSLGKSVEIRVQMISALNS